MSCSGEDAAAAELRSWQISASDGFVWSRLHFNSGLNTRFFQRAVAATLSKRLGERITVLGSAGGTLGGDIDYSGQAAALRPSGLLAAGVSWQALTGVGKLPFVTVSGIVSGSVAPTFNGTTLETATYTSIDFKAIGIVGYTFWGRLSPYVGASLFGGPIFWTIEHRAVTGTDLSHYQVLIGLSLALPARFNVFAEGSPVGEQALSAGAGFSF